nr:hypothetical protein [Segatella oris]
MYHIKTIRYGKYKAKRRGKRMEIREVGSGAIDQVKHKQGISSSS